MRKTVALTAGAMMLAMLLGCSAASPSQSVEGFLNAVKADDKEAMAQYYDGEFDILPGDDSALESGIEDDTESEMAQIADEQFNPKLLGFDYELSNEVVDGDKATVDVNVTTYQLGLAWESFYANLLSGAFAYVFEPNAEELIEDLAVTLLRDKFTDVDKTYTGTATLSLTKVDGAWIVDEIPEGDPIYDVLTGGVVSAMEETEEQ